MSTWISIDSRLTFRATLLYVFWRKYQTGENVLPVGSLVLFVAVRLIESTRQGRQTHDSVDTSRAGGGVDAFQLSGGKTVNIQKWGRFYAQGCRFRFQDASFISAFSPH